MAMLKPRVEICGNIAAGKTTLCKSLAAVGFEPIYESFGIHPFLDAFYQEPSKYSFETEITFLLQHYHDIKIATIAGVAACDFSLVLDKAYAEVTLSRRRRDLFLEIAEELEEEIGQPQKIIYLKCPEEKLLSRIRQRNRSFEKAITIEYLSQISEAIDFRISKVSPQIEILTVDSDQCNFVNGLDEIPSLKNSPMKSL